MNDSVRRKINLPGMALAVFGAGSILVNLLLALLLLISTLGQVSALGPSVDVLLATFLGQGWYLVLCVIGFFASFVVLVAGLRLRTARSPGLVTVGALLAMLPCGTNLCCCFGLPLGLWVLVVLRDKQVQAEFSFS